RALPSPRQLRQAAKEIHNASEQARFHDDFSIDHNQRAADQMGQASAQLHEIADNLQNAHAHIKTGRERLAGSPPPAPPLNRRRVAYPQFTNPLTGRPVHYPGDNLEQVHPESQRVRWKTTERLQAQKQWEEHYGGPP